MKRFIILGVIIVALAGGSALYLQKNPASVDKLGDLASNLYGHIERLLPGRHNDKKMQVARTLLNVPPGEMQEVLAKSYRLRPDNRFMLAVADIDHFFSGRPKEAASAEFVSGRWLISYRDKRVGTLPELPDFDDFTSVLSQWVQQLNGRYSLKLFASHADTSVFNRLTSVLAKWIPGVTRKTAPEPDEKQIAACTRDMNKELAQFLAPHAMAAARQADFLWNSGQHNPALLYAATRALVLLDFQSMDRLEIGDELPAKALALLTITETLTGNKCRDEEALLSYHMGYSNHAVSIARTLPQSDPVGAYVNEDDPRLSQLASADNSSVESHYLLLLSISKRRDADAFAQCLKTYFRHSWLSLPVFKAGLDMNAFSLTPDMAETMPSMVLMRLKLDEGTVPDLADYVKKEITHPDKDFVFVMEYFFGDIQAKFPLILKDFDSKLNSLEAKYSGPFLGGQTYSAYYKGYFYSALSDLGLHYLDALSSSEASVQFARVLGTATNGTAADFRAWYTNLAKSQQGRIDLATLRAQIKKNTSLGAAPFMRTFKEQLEYYRLADPALLQGAKDIVPHLDTRINHRLFLSAVAYSGLLDLKLTEKLDISTLKAASATNKGLQIWYANLNGDVGQIFDILKTSAEVDTKIRALEFLQKQKDADLNLICTNYRQIVQEAPDRWFASQSYASFLRKQKKYNEAIAVLRNWLNRKVNTLGLEDIATHEEIANIYYDEGRFKQGWAEIKPFIKSQKGGAMRIGALLLDKLGHKMEAEKLALFLVDRYPDSLNSRLVLTELYWRHGKYSEAADLLKSSVHALNTAQWGWTVGPVFAEIFKNKPEEAIAAFAQLCSRGFDPVGLTGIAGAVSRAGKNELAFDMYSNIRGRSGLENLEYLVDAYRLLTSYKSKEAALAWLRSKVPPQMYNPLSMISYDTNEFDLLWDFDPGPGNQNEVDWFWITRAAASMVKPISAQQNQAILRYFSINSKGDCAIGRYLVGMAKEQDVFSLMTDVRDRCEDAYYLGLKAWKERRYGDASDWFRVTLEIGRWQTPEYRWAYSILYNWFQSGKSLDQLAKERL